ncbi:alpha/beta hydrolase [Candidatus Dependentiae bacterium]|nr:alpha/beta hydrolase [Candidatus Dependentiae bacterium]
MKMFMIFIMLTGLLSGVCSCDDQVQPEEQVSTEQAEAIEVPELVQPEEPGPVEQTIDSEQDRMVEVLLVEHDPLLQEAIVMRDEAGKNDFVTLVAGEKPFLVSSETKRVAYENNKELNESILFYTKFLKKRGLVRDFLQEPKIFDGKYTKTNTTDNEAIHYMHFDRGSDTLLVIGGALLNMEKVASFVKMFNQYDLIIFNHRGVEHEAFSPLKPSTWPYLLSSTCVAEGLNGSKLKFGFEEEKDVFAVIYDIFKKRSYEKIYGLALCYSAPIFIKAAVTRPGVFDKLILDGSWIYSQSMIERFIEEWRANSKMNWLYKLASTDFFSWLAETVSGVTPPSVDFDFTPYLQGLDIPVLLIHSMNDSLVPTSEFEDIWSYIPSKQKAALLTNCDHIRNHLKRKELYKYVADSFFRNPLDTFVADLQR